MVKEVLHLNLRIGYFSDELEGLACIAQSNQPSTSSTTSAAKCVVKSPAAQQHRNQAFGVLSSFTSCSKNVEA